MKDALGQELKIGDTVFFIYTPTATKAHSMEEGRVLEFTKEKVRVKSEVFRYNSNSYSVIPPTKLVCIKHICGNCNHYIGGGDFNLCCDLPHPEFPCGFLCYHNTIGCENWVKNPNI